MPTLLHISDLHRTSTPRLGNDELLSAILSDTKRWEKECIPYPEVIVVTGDLIQGTRVGHPNPDSEITSQYAEVGTFLQQLTNEIVDSDLSRVIIVPGNHDVHWSRALQAMSPLETCPDGIDVKAFEANSTIRWNWKEQKAYEIVDRDAYESRFELFRRFQANFYADLDSSPLLQDNDIVHIEYPSLGLVVVGFASWHGNDCFCHVGEIDSKALATARELLQASQAPVAIAAWHHGVVGGPRAHEYMDVRIVHRLIDFGFSVGLHGHHHYAGAAPFELRLPNLTSMTLIGAGSLAVGDRELPMGERRQFNIVEIDPDSETVTTHVRAMSSAGVFTGSHRDDFGGNTYVTLPPVYSGSKRPALTSIGSPAPEPQFEDSSVCRQNRPTRLDKIKNFHHIVPFGSVTGLGRYHCEAGCRSGCKGRALPAANKVRLMPLHSLRGNRLSAVSPHGSSFAPRPGVTSAWY